MCHQFVWWVSETTETRGEGLGSPCYLGETLVTSQSYTKLSPSKEGRMSYSYLPEQLRECIVCC